jgi:hypothetical protein
MDHALERPVDALLAPLSRTIYLATGRVFVITPAGEVVVQLDGAGAGLVAVAMPAEWLEVGTHVLMERVRDRWHLHGAVPDDLAIGIGDGS